MSVKTETKTTTEVQQSTKSSPLTGGTIAKPKLKKIKQDEATETPMEKLKRLENGELAIIIFLALLTSYEIQQI